jgi:murein L,D-transpeptidase YafK
MIYKYLLFTLTLILSHTSFGHAKSLPETCQLTKTLSKQSHFGEARANKADFVLVDKSRRLVHLFRDNQIIKSFRVGLGSQPNGAKHQEGDGKTPEGSYYIDSRNSGSDYHLSLHVSYPDQEDINYARRKGVSPGGDIMIHGLPNESWKRIFIRHPSDWTKGCVAVNNSEIEEIWDLVRVGTPIDLCP